jgi:tetratricopeptide (TPR) repeat protein
MNIPIFLALASFLGLGIEPQAKPPQPQFPAADHILFGDLKIQAKAEDRLPLSFVIVLYNNSGLVHDRQTIANNGRYRFLKVPNGDWELVVEADSMELVRVPFLLIENQSGDVRKDLELEWKSGPSQPGAGAVSAKDFYTRNPANAPLMEQATAAIGKKDYAAAIAALKQVVEADPKDFEAWTELGTAQFMQGSHGDAEQSYRRALGERTAYPVALLNLGKLQYSDKKYDAAIQTLSQLVAAQPDSAEGHRFLGEAYLRAKKGSKAVPELEAAVRLDPAGQAEAHLSLASLYDAAGYKNLAAAEYEKFLARKPDYRDRQKLEKYIQNNKK